MLTVTIKWIQYLSPPYKTNKEIINFWVKIKCVNEMFVLMMICNCEYNQIIFKIQGVFHNRHIFYIIYKKLYKRMPKSKINPGKPRLADVKTVHGFIPISQCIPCIIKIWLTI